MQCENVVKKEKYINVINQQIKEKQSLVSDYYKKIEVYRKQINKLQKELLQICNHNWVIDRDASYYDRTIRYCSICGCNT